MPYQSLIKIFFAEHLVDERGGQRFTKGFAAEDRPGSEAREGVAR